MRDKDLDPLTSKDINVNKPKVPKNKAKAKPKDDAKEHAKDKVKDKISNNDSNLKELYALLAPDDYEIGISDNRIKRARLVCQEIDRYSEEEKKYLVYPTLYQLHLYGYQLIEISAILGLAPSTIHLYLKNIRKAYKHQFLEDRTSEEVISESLAHYDFIAKEANRQAAKLDDGDKDKVSFMRLAAQSESEKNKLLEATGYFESIKRRNELQSLDSANTNNAKDKNELVNDIKDIVAAFKVTELKE